MREIAQHLGVEVFICDDGSMSQDPLFAKVPDLVRAMAYERHRCYAALQHLAQGMDIYGDSLTPEQLVAHAIRATQDLKNQISEITKENERQMSEASRVMADQYTSMAKLVEQVTAEREKNRELEKQLLKLAPSLGAGNSPDPAPAESSIPSPPKSRAPAPPSGEFTCNMCGHVAYTQEQLDQHIDTDHLL
jgi:rubrerythrin